jgi:hypothetical protein
MSDETPKRFIETDRRKQYGETPIPKVPVPIESKVVVPADGGIKGATPIPRVPPSTKG